MTYPKFTDLVARHDLSLAELRCERGVSEWVYELIDRLGLAVYEGYVQRLERERCRRELRAKARQRRNGR